MKQPKRTRQKKLPPDAQRESPAAKRPSGSASTDAGRFRIQTVSRITGLGSAVLRAWERRFELIKPTRGASGYREYTEEDLRVLQRAKRMLDAGLTIGEVARIGREALASAESEKDLLPQGDPGRSPVSEGEAGDLVRAFIGAIGRGEISSAEEVVVRGFYGRPLRAALRSFVLPALVAVGDAWERGEFSPGVERVATHLMRVPLELFLHNANVGLGPVEVISTPAPGDEHELGALLVALELARAGHRSVHLGGRLSVRDLATVVQRTGARWLCLSFVHGTTVESLVEQLRALKRELPSHARIVVGGHALQGMEGSARAAGAEVPSSLDDLVRLVGSPMLASFGI